MRRSAYLAGAWYPADENDCRLAIEGHAAEAKVEQGQWRGIIGPHAGWTFSGDAAGRSYRWLAEAQPTVDLVVMIGSHRGPTGPNTVFRGDAWETPLGAIPTALATADRLAGELDLSDEPISPGRPDNAVELHLPFVRHFFPNADMLMLGVADSPTAIAIGRSVGRAANEGSDNAVFVGSTDLTHYGPNYGFSPAGGGDDAIAWVRNENDKGFIDAILARDPEAVVQHGVANHSACCSGAVVATMAAVAAYGGTEAPRLVDHYLSCDVQRGSSFVGYAGIVL
ncbi:MAG: AmmeMemoRadiSam system protein B [Myxococcota bacterium]